MSSGELFLKTLKRIGYLEADNLEGSDFDWMFSDKDLNSLLELFCSLNENNVLSTQEILEYSSLTEDELAEIEIFQKSGYLEKIDTIDEKRNETYLLQEQLSQIEKYSKTLEGQVELYKKHGKDLLEEKETKQRLLLDEKRKYQMQEISAISYAENDFVSNLQNILKQVQNLETLMNQSNSKESKIPASSYFQSVVEEYLKVEEKILHFSTTFMNNQFQLNENDHSLSFTIWENSKNEELYKEASFLHKGLKQKMVDKIIYEKELMKTENIIKHFEALTTSPDFNCHSAELRLKLDDAMKLNQKLKKREEDFNSYLIDAVSKLTDTQFSEVSASVIEDMNKLLQHAIDEMLLPLNILIHQRARLEMLIVSLQGHSIELQNLKQLKENFLSQAKEELLSYQERKAQMENKVKENIPNQDAEDPATSLYLSLYKILARSSELGMIEDTCRITLQDIVQKTNKYFEAQENISKKQEENLKTIELMEKNATSMEGLLTCTDKDYINWHELQQSLNADLNLLHMKLASLQEVTAECHEEHNQKLKVLEGSGNLRLARQLFIYASMNKELFNKCIDDIKEAVENTEGYKQT